MTPVQPTSNYSIPVEPPSEPYFSFLWHGTYYQYSCLPNGYAQAPMLFMKIRRKPFSYLHRQGHLYVVYMDYTYLQGNSFVSCQQNIYATVTLLQDLGFNINQKKSVLVPTQKLEFLGFLLDSLLMTIMLTSRRKGKYFESLFKLIETRPSKNSVCLNCHWNGDCWSTWGSTWSPPLSYSGIWKNRCSMPEWR